MLLFILGALAGTLAFGILLLVLVPVLRGARRASLPKGLMAVAASFALLMLGLFTVYLLAESGLLMFLAGEMVAFFAGWIILACALIACK